MDTATILQLQPLEALVKLRELNLFSGEDGEEVYKQLEELVTKTGMHPLLLLEGRQRNREEEPMDPVLASFDLDGVARYIKEHECRRVVVMCGAGISTSAGIPDFRTRGTGLYDNLQRFNLPAPEAVFQLNYFRNNPAAFYELAKEMWPGNYDPTPTHYFLKLLHDKGILLRCYSQNIDSLECAAGLPSAKLVAAHGNFDEAHVIDKDPEVLVDINVLKAAIDRGEEGWQALREEKGNLVKPKIVFFGEDLPRRFAELCEADLSSCDLLIVLGTSLVVAPFCNLVSMAAGAVPRLLINNTSAGTCDRLQNGFRFDKDESGNWRDVFHAGDCDGGCRALIAALGWSRELERLIETLGASSASLAPWVVEKGV